MANMNGNERLQELREAKRALVGRIFGPVVFAKGMSYLNAIPEKSNVTGFGIGSGQGESEFVIRVYVKEIAKVALYGAPDIPRSINGFEVQIVETGEIVPYQRPTPAGVSGAHRQLGGSGTLGCLVNRNGDGTYILSNNHVMARSNNAAAGDPIVEPSLPDSGGTATDIARLTDFERIDFSGGDNRIDAAIAELLKAGDMTPDIKTIGHVTPQSVQPTLGMRVVKHGRTTGGTTGGIVDLAADIHVNYGVGVAVFIDQIAVEGTAGLFSKPGDSGSLILEEEGRRPVALLFAGGNAQTFGNPIDDVLNRFGSTIL